MTPDTALAARALETIRRHRLARPGERVLAAVSGGADSVALFLLLRELEASGELTVAGVAHLNHQLRGADADADEAFVAALAAKYDVPLIADRVDVAALARTQKRSIEDAARLARHAFFDRAAAALDADVVAVAHTKEDQAETFLLRLMRGAGTRGLAAIRPRAGRIVRPLLEVERAALRDYLATQDQPFREDATNADVAIPRNRVRHELIPYLQSRFSPAVTDVLARAAELARQDEDFLQSEAIKLAARIVLSDVTVRLDAAGLNSAPRALSSRVAHAALQRLAGSKPIHFDHVERVLALAADAAAGEGRAISLPGQIAVRVGDRIELRPESRARRRAPGSNPGHRTSDVGPRASDVGPAHRSGSRSGRERGPAHRSARLEGGEREGGPAHRSGSPSGREGGTRFAVSLSIPGEVQVGGQTVAAERLTGTAASSGRLRKKWAARGPEVGVAAAELALPLAVRSRRPGDRFRPLGAPGRRKLQDFLVDRKVRREDRDAVPLVVDARDRIVWVVGQSVAEDFRVTDPSQGVILLKVRHLGGVG